jgi:hypothetical protein
LLFIYTDRDSRDLTEKGGNGRHPDARVSGECRDSVAVCLRRPLPARRIDDLSILHVVVVYAILFNVNEIFRLGVRICRSSFEFGGSDKRMVHQLACRTRGNERRVACATDIFAVGTGEDVPHEGNYRRPRSRRHTRKMDLKSIDKKNGTGAATCKLDLPPTDSFRDLLQYHIRNVSRLWI